MAKKSRSRMPNDAELIRNAMDALVANIRFAGADRAVDTICITSSIPNEGKSIVSVNLAANLAESGFRVLIVECDVHRRSLAGLLGVRARTGMYSVLLGRVSHDKAAVPTKTKNLYLLDCEPSIPNPANVFASRQFHDLVKNLRSAYDYVIFDTPPLSAYIDGAVIGSTTDATLLVTRWNFVKRDDVRSSVEQLRKADANVIGTVLTCCEPEHDNYYYGNEGREAKYDSGKEAPHVANATSASVNQQVAPSQKPARAEAVATRQAPAASVQHRNNIPPDSTAQFLADAGYGKAVASASGASRVVPPNSVRRNHI